MSFGYEIDRNSEKQAESSIQGIKSMASKLLGAIGVVFSIRGMADLAQAAADAEALKSQFTQVFGEMEQEAASKLQAISDDTGVAVNRMKGSFTQIAAFAKTTGLEQAESLDIANRAMSAVADSAAFYDRSIEDVTETMRSFLKGNFENDAALGLSCTEVTRNTAANALYGKSFKDLSEAEKQFTLLQMVEDANKASGALGQAARESDTWTNQLGNLQQAMTDLKAAAGSTFLKPAVGVLKLLTGLAQGAATAISGLTAENGLLTVATERYHALVKRLQPAIDRVTSTLSDGMSRGREIVQGVVDRLGGVENALSILAIFASAFLVAMSWGKVIEGARMFTKVLHGINSVLNVGNLKLLAIAAAVTAVALIVEDFIHFLLGNDSVIGTIFDKAGIGAENVRQVIIKAWNAVVGFLGRTWDTIKNIVSQFADVLLKILVGLADFISSVFKGDWKGAWDAVKGIFQTVWDSITSLLSGAWDSIKNISKIAVEKLPGLLESGWELLKGAVSSVAEALPGLLQAGWDKLKELAVAAVEALPGALAALWEAFKSAISAVGDNIGPLLDAGWNMLKDLAVAAVGALPGLLSGGWELLKNGISAVGDGLGTLLDAGWSALTDAAGAAVNALPGALSAGWDLLTSGIAAVGNGFGTLLDAGWTALTEAAGNAVDALPGALSAGWETLKSGISAVGTSIGPLLDAGWETLTSGAEIVANGLWSLLSGGFDAVTSGITEIGSGLGTLLDDGWNALSSKAQEVASGFWDSISSGWNAVTEGISNIGDGLGSLLDEGWEQLKDAAGGAVDWIQDKWEGIKGFFGGIWDSLTGGSDDSGASMEEVSVAASEAGESFDAAGGSITTAGESATSAGEAFSAAGDTITLSITGTAEEVAESVAKMQSSMSMAWEAIRSKTVTVWNGVKTAVANAMSQAKSSVSSAISSMKASFDSMQSVASSAYKWGYDICAQMSNGIKAAAGSVKEAAVGVANDVRSVLHFSLPDEGPLADADTYMPDFMSLLAKGISSSKEDVLDKARGVAEGISVLMKGATASVATATAGTVNNTTSSITQNVNIANTYSGGSMETQRNVSKAMKKSAVDATTQMARSLAWARG